MELTRLSSKGQVVIPRAVREAMQLKVGTEFVVRQEGVSVILEPKAQAKKLTPQEAEAELAKIRARNPYLGPSVSIEDMDKAVTQMIRRDWQRLERQRKP
jgi:AbrB family looped-hinge helix DNA binding protein